MVQQSWTRFVQAVSHTVNGPNQITAIVNRSELPAQTLDMIINGVLINVTLVVVRRLHERAAAPDNTGSVRQRSQDQKLGDSEGYRLALPGAYMTPRVHPEMTCTQLGRS